MPNLSNDNNKLKMGKNVLVEDGVIFGDNVMIFDNVIIRKGAVIGDNVTLGYYEGECPGTVTEIGERAKIRSGAVIYHGFKLGAGSSVGHNTVIREMTIIGENTYIGALIMMEGEITIGDNCGINAQCHITRFSRIDDYVFFGPGVMSMNDNNMAHKRKGHGQSMKGFTAKNYVRVGGGCTLLPGVVLEEGSVVAAGSLVTRDVPHFSLVMGRPARLSNSDGVDVNSMVITE